MIEVIAGIFILLGSGFVLIAGIGIVKLGDVLNRMHASTKAGTLGAILTLTGAALHVGDGGLTARVVAIVVFLLLTAPIAAHMIGRATVQMRRYRDNHD